ncbi:hypothetical protein VTH82DRAFT_7921 [Thermothelomyces myriococcoides]
MQLTWTNSGELGGIVE